MTPIDLLCKPCPNIIQFMVINLMPLIAHSVPGGWLVLKILAVLVYMENERRTCPSFPERKTNTLNESYNRPPYILAASSENKKTRNQRYLFYTKEEFLPKSLRVILLQQDA